MLVCLPKAIRSWYIIRLILVPNSRPLFYDFNGDGLVDIIVGNLGYFNNTPYYSSTLAYYQNTGDRYSSCFY